MRIHNLYCDANGESHWRDVDVEWIEERNFSKLSARLPATGIIFRETSGDYDLSWHPAPRRQYIINLDGGVQITASDGQARVIGAGEACWWRTRPARAICRSRSAARCGARSSFRLNRGIS